MNTLMFLSFEFGALALLLLLVISGVIVATRGYIRFALVGLYAISLPLIYMAFAGLLGEAKPLRWEKDAMSEKVQVIAYEVKSNDSIFLWLRLPHRTEPRYYIMDYDQKKAKQINEAARDAEQKQTGMLMQMLPKTIGQTETSDGHDYEVMFYAAPQPAHPLKDYEAGPYGGSPY